MKTKREKQMLEAKVKHMELPRGRNASFLPRDWAQKKYKDKAMPPKYRTQASFLARLTQVLAVKLSYTDIRKWKKDYEQLCEMLLSANYTTVDEAVDDFKTIGTAWGKYLKNLKEHISRDYYAVVDYYKEVEKEQDQKLKRLKKTGREKIAKKFEEFEDAMLDWLFYADPSRYSKDPKLNINHHAVPNDVGIRMNFYVNSLFKDQAKLDKTKKTSESLWKIMREYLSDRPGFDNNSKSVDHGLESDSYIEYMGLTFVNELYHTNDYLSELLDRSKRHLIHLKKLMPEVFYGRVELKNKPSEAKKTIKLGDAWLDAAGRYFIKQDHVEIYADGLKGELKDFGTILVHELAHRFYYKFMDATDRQRWEHFFDNLKTDTASDYAKTNASEDFAEAVTYYVLNKGFMKSQDVRDRLEAILKGRRITAKHKYMPRC